jgi:hypothetical protein
MVWSSRQAIPFDKNKVLTWYKILSHEIAGLYVRFFRGFECFLRQTKVIGVRIAGGNSQGDFPMQAVLAIAKSRACRR